MWPGAAPPGSSSSASGARGAALAGNSGQGRQAAGVAGRPSASASQMAVVGALWCLDKRQPVKGLGAAVRDYVPSPAEEAAIRAIVDAIQASAKSVPSAGESPSCRLIVCIRRQLAKRREGQIKATFASWCRHVECMLQLMIRQMLHRSITSCWNDRRSYQARLLGRRIRRAANLLSLFVGSAHALTGWTGGGGGCRAYRHHQDLRTPPAPSATCPRGKRRIGRRLPPRRTRNADGRSSPPVARTSLRWTRRAVEADDYGRLYRLPDGLFVRVACHSICARIRSSHTCRSAYEAVAATFGMRAVDYCPTIQS